MPPGTPCETCGGTKAPAQTDHCHDHGWVRGLLCGSCNSLLSFVDKRVAPKAESALLAALVAVRSRCPECEQFGLSDLQPSPEAQVKKMNLRIEDETALRLVHQAARSKRSLNGQAEWYIERGLDADELQEKEDVSVTHYQDATGWHRKHDVYGGPHDEPPGEPDA